jgi:GTP-binding protein
MGSDCNGLSRDPLVLHVPVGTVVKDQATGEVLFDLDKPDQRVVAAKGGRGGLGNMNFANSTRQAPRFAEPGRPGEEKHLLLELKLLADVGLIGFPNAGKSTFVSRVSRARPKIADYPFTTLVPNLGMVAYKDRLSFVIADIPGLIEGAHTGAGLGHQFLRHVERCRVLIHLIDCGAEDPERTPLSDFDKINRELALYSPELATKPQIVVGNKIDLPDAKVRFKKLKTALKRRKIDVLPISAATGEGLGDVLDHVAAILFAPQKPTKNKGKVAARRAEKRG